MRATYTRGGFARPGTSTANRTGSWRQERPIHQHSSAPCHAHCPAGEDPQAYIAALQEGKERAAWELLVAANPLPAITGRVCHHPCESGCNRGGLDEAIAIHGVERYLGDEAVRQGWDYGLTLPKADVATVAVVGAGPAGLSAAYHLMARGYRVTLFDARAEAGGLLRSAIPPYRLPRQLLNAELERLLGIGFECRFRQRLGRDMSLNDLKEEFDALFLAPGTHRPRPWSVDGVTQSDLQSGFEMLQGWVEGGTLPVDTDAVAVVGGGNTAMDLARALRHQGVAQVHVITFQALPAVGVAPEEAMSAVPREIDQAQEEGVIIHDRRGIRRLLLRGERVVGVELVRMKELDRGQGRREAVAFEGTETVLEVQQVIPAIGQEVTAEGFGKLLREGFLRPDGWGRIESDGVVFCGGDARGDRGTVSAAVGDGRRAAKAIDDALRGRALPAFALPEGIPLKALNTAYFEAAPRAREAVVPPGERGPEVEVDLGYTAVQIRGEAGRCLSCGNCLACDNCWMLCPDLAVLKTRTQASDGSHYVFDYDFCKGCGLCAQECPPGYIRMIPEP